MKFEKMCESMVGKQVRVSFMDGGAPISGKCIGYTKAIDNDPEIASVDIRSDGILYGFDEPEVAKIEEIMD